MSDTRKRGRSGLGRGLDALMGDLARDHRQTEHIGSSVSTVPITLVAPHPEQPRRRFDDAALDELAASIEERGIIQPLVVRRHGHEYQIVAGERRWRAAQRAGLHEVPVVVRDYTDAETFQIAIIENIQRQDLNAIEEAEAYRRLMAEFGHTQDALARTVHKSRSHVANLLRLLELPSKVQTMVLDDSLSMGHARALIGADDPVALADHVVARGLTVRQTEKLASSEKPQNRKSPSNGRRDTREVERNEDIAALERQLADLLGLKVTIDHREKGGSITLDYSTLDQLDMVCQRLSGEVI